MISEPAAVSMHEAASPVIGARPRARYLRTKRVFDVLFATVLLVLLTPVWIVAAYLVRLSSDGSILYRQPRVGLDGRIFTCLKFRTMVSDAHILLEHDDYLKTTFLEEWKLARDPRVTPIGRVLRKSSIDELPQLWNVVKGEMSLVGPRPVQVDELRQRYGRHAPIVTLVRPGMTGLWQISGRSSVPYEERVALDVQYVYKSNFWFDLSILIRTIPVVLIARGAL